VYAINHFFTNTPSPNPTKLKQFLNGGFTIVSSNICPPSCDPYLFLSFQNYLLHKSFLTCKGDPLPSCCPKIIVSTQTLTNFGETISGTIGCPVTSIDFPIESKLFVPCSCTDDGDFENCYNSLGAYFSISDVTSLLNIGVYEEGTIKNLSLLCQIKTAILANQPSLTPNAVFLYMKAILEAGIVYEQNPTSGVFSSLSLYHLNNVDPACTTTSTSTSTSTTSTSTTSTTSTSTTSTSTSTSTTSTTTCGPCRSWDITINAADISDATGNSFSPNNTVFAQYQDCFNDPFDPDVNTIAFTTPGLKNNAVCSCTAPQLGYFKNDSLISAISTSTNTGIDCANLTTTTSTTTVPCECYVIENDSTTAFTPYSFINCSGTIVSAVLSPDGSVVVCTKGLVNDLGVSFDIIDIEDIDDPLYSSCSCYPTPTTSTSTTTSTTTCNCFEDIQVNISISGVATEGNIKAINCDGLGIFIPVDAGVNTINDCIKQGTLQNVGNATITDQLGGTPCCQ
jgi:hypothetical protein